MSDHGATPIAAMGKFCKSFAPCLLWEEEDSRSSLSLDNLLDAKGAPLCSSINSSNALGLNLHHDYERGVTSLVIHWNLYHFQTFRLIKPRGGGTDHRWVDGGMIDLSTCG